MCDRSGNNVREWETFRTTSAPVTRSGGAAVSYRYGGMSDLRCDTNDASDRNTGNDIIDFRCCAPWRHRAAGCHKEAFGPKESRSAGDREHVTSVMARAGSGSYGVLH